MKFLVLKTFKGSIDGHNVVDFKQGEILENDARLTPHFLKWAFDNKGFIEEIKEQKMLNKVIENKAILEVSENKEIEEVHSDSETIIEEVSENKLTKKKGKK